MMNRIVITGEGIVSAIGVNKVEVLQSLRSKRSGIGPMHYLASTHQELPVGEVPLSNDEMTGELGLKGEPFLNRTTLLGMMAVRQALSDAHIDMECVKKQGLRVVLVSGTTVAGMDVTEQLFAQLEQGDEALGCLHYHSAGSCTARMADYFSIFSEYTTVSTACSSAANALLVGARMLQEREADIVVAGGAEALSVFHLNGFRSLMILDSKACRPFDAHRGGLTLGEGAAYVVMETAALSSRRGVKPYGVLSGWGNACDAYHLTASSADGDGAYLAMAEALETAGLGPQDIQYVNAHGTGTLNNDLSESVALQRVFGKQMPPVSSTKSFTGHATSASGSIETVICLLALEHQFIPANLGWTEAMEGGIVPTMGTDYSQLRHVLCNAFGFGGNDTSLVFSTYTHSSLHTSPFESVASPSKLKAQRATCNILSRVEITSEAELAEIRDYVSPMESRRMGKLMKSSLLASLKALKAAGVNQPDAIITATAMGCLENSEQLLRQLTDEGETMLKPTLFMQSTHNTISSNIAIHLGCHGYNITYTQDTDSLSWAIRDAEQLLRSGKCKTVLVGCHDETTPLLTSLSLSGAMPSYSPFLTPHSSFHSLALVMSCGE